MLHFTLLEKQEQDKLKTSRRRNNKKSNKINEMKQTKKYKESIEQKAGSLKK
jgi:hypothetical protein